MTLSSAVSAEEYGLIENLTAFSFAIASFFALIIFIKEKTLIWAVFSYLMSMAFMRELDLHKHWTTDSILKSRFYLNPETPMIEKVIGLFFILTLLLCIFFLLKSIPQFIQNIRQKQKPVFLVLSAFGLIATSKFFDAMARIIPSLKEFHTQNSLLLKMTEESLELVAADLFIFICILKISKIFKNRSTH